MLTIREILQRLLCDRRYSIIVDPGTGSIFYGEHITRGRYERIRARRPREAMQREGQYMKVASLDAVSRRIVSRSRFLAVSSLIVFLVAGCGIFSLTAFIFSAGAGAVVSLTLSIAVFFFVNAYLNRAGGIVSLRYKLHGQRAEVFDGLTSMIRDLGEADYIWQIDSIMENVNKRYHGGAPQIYERKLVRILRATPRFIYCNVNVYSMKYGGQRLYFYPDFIMLDTGRGYRITPYESLYISYREIEFHESLYSPGDAEVVGFSWLHPRKDGTPDRRFSHNPRVNIHLYAEVILSTLDQGDVQLLVSRTGRARRLASFLGQHAAHYREEIYPRSNQKFAGRSNKRNPAEEKGGEKEERNARSAHADNKKNGKHPGHYNSERLRACSELGIAVFAGHDEIKSAYRSMVKLYHPDRHMSMPSEEIKKAEEKIKEINRAYEFLKKNSLSL